MIRRLSYALRRALVLATCAAGRVLGIARREENQGDMSRQVRRHIDLIAFIRSTNLSWSASILDVGCGPGWLGERLLAEGFVHVQGCDWHDGSGLDPSARGRIKYARVDINKEGLKPYADHSFDCIVCSDVMEHLENPAATLREFARIVVPGGRVYLTMPNAFNFFQRLYILRTGNSSRYKSERLTVPFSHITMIPTWVMESLCDRAGFDIVQEGKNYIWWKNHFWFLNRGSDRLWSYAVSYYLVRKAGQAPADA